MTQEADRELLEMAAKAAGVEIMFWSGRDVGCPRAIIKPDGLEWNPLTDDGDALRLAVRLNIVIWECAQYSRAMTEVRYGKARGEYWEQIENDDQYAATRRAICLAAAEIGKTK